MIDHDTWLLLAKRLEVIDWNRAADVASRERIQLEFDSYDQATIHRTGLDDQGSVGDTPAVLPP